MPPPSPASLTGAGAAPARFGGPLPAVPLLAAPFAQEMSAVPSQTWPAGMAEPSVWNPPAERLTWAERRTAGFPSRRPARSTAAPARRTASDRCRRGERRRRIRRTSSCRSSPRWSRPGSASPRLSRRAPPGSPPPPSSPPWNRAGPFPRSPRPSPNPGRPPVTAAGGPPRRRASPRSGGTTASGLPKRAPRDNLIPGSVSPLIEPQPPAAPVSAEKVRSRLSSFQEGVRKARNELPNREN